MGEADKMLRDLRYMKEYEDSSVEIWNYEERFWIRFNKICKSVDFRSKAKIQFLGLKYHRNSIDMQELLAINKKVEELRMDRISNKTSDENVANIEDDVRLVRKYLENSSYKESDSDFFKNCGWKIVDLDIVKAMSNILAEREQMLQRYEERDNELWERVKQCNNLQTEIDRLYQENEELIEINRKQANRKKELEEEHKNVLDLIFEYGQTDGEHHKMWVIDQIVRMLTKDKYNEWIKDYVYDEETGDTYSWDKGIAP